MEFVTLSPQYDICACCSLLVRALWAGGRITVCGCWPVECDTAESHEVLYLSNDGTPSDQAQLRRRPDSYGC